jgi:hypothetical protein
MIRIFLFGLWAGGTALFALSSIVDFIYTPCLKRLTKRLGIAILWPVMLFHKKSVQTMFSNVGS